MESIAIVLKSAVHFYDFSLATTRNLIMLFVNHFR